MLTAICVGLLSWLLFMGYVIWHDGDKPEDIPAFFLLLVMMVAFCVVVQHFGSMLIGAIS